MTSVVLFRVRGSSWPMSSTNQGEVGCAAGVKLLSDPSGARDTTARSRACDDEELVDATVSAIIKSSYRSPEYSTVDSTKASLWFPGSAPDLPRYTSTLDRYDAKEYIASFMKEWLHQLQNQFCPRPTSYLSPFILNPSDCNEDEAGSDFLDLRLIRLQNTSEPTRTAVTQPAIQPISIGVAYSETSCLNLARTTDGVDSGCSSASLDANSLELRLPRVASDPPVPPSVPPLIFVFTGSGAQWPSMGRELLVYPRFRRSLEEAAAYLKSLECQFDLLDELQAPEHMSLIHEPHVGQPTCTALQIALVDLLEEWGVRPSIVVGHSSGEIAAAYTKGAVSRETAWKIAYHRGRLCASFSKRGAMLAVPLSKEIVNLKLQRMVGPKPVIGCINGPASVTLSGCEGSISGIEALLLDEGVSCKRLFVKTAYHSPEIEDLAQPYLDALASLEPRTTRVRGGSSHMFSSLTGRQIGDAALVSPQYWVDNLILPVQFQDAMTEALRSTLTSHSAPAVLEIGPHGALQVSIKQIIAAQDTACLKLLCASLLTRGRDAMETVFEAVDILIHRGYPMLARRAKVLDPWVIRKPGRINIGTVSPRVMQTPATTQFMPLRYSPTHASWPFLGLSEYHWSRHGKLLQISRSFVQLRVPDLLHFSIAGTLQYRDKIDSITRQREHPMGTSHLTAFKRSKYRTMWRHPLHLFSYSRYWPLRLQAILGTDSPRKPYIEGKDALTAVVGIGVRKMDLYEIGNTFFINPLITIVIDDRDTIETQRHVAVVEIE